MNKLLPCPFCGHQPELDNPDTLHPNGTGWLIRPNGMKSYHRFIAVPKSQWCYSLHCCTCCGGCGANVTADSADEAISLWNRRVYV